MERLTEIPVESETKVGNYFTEDKKNLEFFSSGCTMLDCILGGGWPLGRISNIVGNKSTSKSLLAIEACANFARTFPTGKIYLRESEAAFDVGYAQALGMPVDRVDFGDDIPLFTVEDLFEDLERVLTALPKDCPALYIVDSLDALSDREELDREIDKGSYGAAKAKLLSQLFRRTVQRLSKSRIHLCFISQIRDKIGVMFGKKTTRSGGRALDFYASIVLELSMIETLHATKQKIKRATGIKVKAQVTKNKISLPFRDCTFDVIFGLGVDNLGASLDWLEDIGRLDDIIGQKRAGYIKELDKLDDEKFLEETARINSKVVDIWREVETQFLPSRRKHS